MTASNFNLRGIPADVVIILKREADQQHISVNVLILRLIEAGVGYVHTMKRSTYHELDHLAGTWSAQDEKRFAENTKHFEKIDKDLWK
jgi:hypothetical protein